MSILTRKSKFNHVLRWLPRLGSKIKSWKVTEMKEGPVKAGETERLWIRSAINKGLRASLGQREIS